MTRRDHLGVTAISRSICLLTEFCHVSFLLPTGGYAKIAHKYKIFNTRHSLFKKCCTNTT